MNREEVLKHITPDENYRESIDFVIQSLQKSIQELNINCEVQIGGSMAKGTNLKGDADCDIFVKFAPQYDTISKELQKILEKTPFIFETVHGSRDYFQFTHEINFEIVPVLNIKHPYDAQNVTDMSPMHVNWAKERITPKLQEDIRLTKAFCKANRTYGAESYIGGFSGHVIDILVLFYGGFEELLTASQNWNEKDVIDIMEFHQDAHKTLNESKLDSPLIVIDPLLADRNAASALNLDKFLEFKKSAKAYLENSTEDFFIKKEIVLPQKPYLEITIKPLEGKKDIVGAKLKKAFEFFVRNLEENGFTITHATWEWDKHYIGLESLTIPSEYVITGPPLQFQNPVAQFELLHDNTFRQNDRSYAREHREFTSALKLLQSLAQNEYLKSKLIQFHIEEVQ